MPVARLDPLQRRSRIAVAHSTTRTLHSIAVVLVCFASSSTGQSLESAPQPEFRLGEVTYGARKGDGVVPESQLVRLLGVADGEVTHGLQRCQLFRRADGEVTLCSGARVFSIKGIDQSIAIAAEVGAKYVKLYAH